MAKRAAYTCFFLLTGLAFVGTFVFDVLAITLPAFKIAGGIILLLIGIVPLGCRCWPDRARSPR